MFCDGWRVTLTASNSPWNTLAAWLTLLLCQLLVAYPGQPESLAFVLLSLFKRKIIAMELQLQVYLDASVKGLAIKDKKKKLLFFSYVYITFWRQMPYCWCSISWTWSHSNPWVFLRALFEEEQHQKWENIKDRMSELMVNSLKSTYAGYFPCHRINLLPWLVSNLISSVPGQSWSLNIGWHASIVETGGTGARSSSWFALLITI